MSATRKGVDTYRPLILRRLGEPDIVRGLPRVPDEVEFTYNEDIRAITYLSGVFALRMGPKVRSEVHRFSWSYLGHGWWMPSMRKTRDKLGLARFVAGYVVRNGPKVVLSTWSAGYPRGSIVPRSFQLRADILRGYGARPSRFRRLFGSDSPAGKPSGKSFREWTESTRGPKSKPRPDQVRARKARPKATEGSPGKADTASGHKSAKMKAALAAYAAAKAAHKAKKLGT